MNKKVFNPKLTTKQAILALIIALIIITGMPIAGIILASRQYKVQQNQETTDEKWRGGHIVFSPVPNFLASDDWFKKKLEDIAKQARNLRANSTSQATSSPKVSSTQQDDVKALRRQVNELSFNQCYDAAIERDQANFKPGTLWKKDVNGKPVPPTKEEIEASAKLASDKAAEKCNKLYPIE